MGGRYPLLLALFPEILVEDQHNCGVKLFAGGNLETLAGKGLSMKCGGRENLLDEPDLGFFNVGFVDFFVVSGFFF